MRWSAGARWPKPASTRWKNLCPAPLPCCPRITKGCIMANSSSTAPLDPARARAQFYAPELAFDRPVPKVPAAVFWTEREQAFAAGAPTGFVPLDQSGALGSAWPATTPTMLARYVIIRKGEQFGHELASTGEVYYVIRGEGETTCLNETFRWKAGDAFCLPGGKAVEHRADAPAILMMVTNEPELAYLRAGPGTAPAGAIQPTLFPGEEIDLQLRNVHGRSEEHTSELQSLMRISYADFCVQKKI